MLYFQVYDLGKMATLAELPGAFVIGAGAASCRVAGMNCEVVWSDVLVAVVGCAINGIQSCGNLLLSLLISLVAFAIAMVIVLKSCNGHVMVMSWSCHGYVVIMSCLSYMYLEIVAWHVVNLLLSLVDFQMMPNAVTPSNTSEGLNLSYIAKVSPQVLTNQ